MKQTIAIIGAGEPEGTILSLAAARSGSRLLLVDEHSDRLRQLRSALLGASPSADVEIMTCERISSWEADVIVLSIPQVSLEGVGEKLRDVCRGKVVAASAASGRAAERLSRAFPHSKIVLIARTGTKFTFTSRHPEAAASLRALLGAEGDSPDAPHRVDRAAQELTHNQSHALSKGTRT